MEIKKKLAWIFGSIGAAVLAALGFIFGRKIAGGNDRSRDNTGIDKQLKSERDSNKAEGIDIESERSRLKSERDRIRAERRAIAEEKRINKRNRNLLDELNKRYGKD